jgi:sodium-dependent dicarboxylate transporter 2/3/5
VLQITFPIELTDISLAKKEISRQIDSAGKIQTKEITVLIILITTILLWIFFSSFVYLGLAVIAIIGSVLLFLTGCISWDDVERRVPWGIILLYGGAITLGIGMQETGAGTWIAHLIFNTMNVNFYFIILGIIIFSILLTNIMSNIGAVAILLPIGLAISSEIPDISPLLASMIIALSGGLAFMLVIATPGNAISYSSGYFSTRDLAKSGIIANIICISVLFFIAIVYWGGILNL